MQERFKADKTSLFRQRPPPEFDRAEEVKRAGAAVPLVPSEGSEALGRHKMCGGKESCIDVDTPGSRRPSRDQLLVVETLQGGRSYAGSPIGKKGRSGGSQDNRPAVHWGKEDGCRRGGERNQPLDRRFL